jgi:hypothetical protein
MFTVSFTYDALISYAQQDEAWAMRVAEELEARGLKTFLDTATVGRGVEWEQQFVRRATASQHLVVLWSGQDDPERVNQEVAFFQSVVRDTTAADDASEPRLIIPVYLSGYSKRLAKYVSIDAIRKAGAYEAGPAAVPAATWREVVDELETGIRHRHALSEQSPRQPATPRNGVSTPRPGIFICYRREESAGHAGRLFDALTQAVGEHQVFMDLTLEPGVDLVDAIEEAVGGCRVLLAVIGPRWAQIEDESRGTRLNDPDDYVHIEIRAALERPDVRVIPVLVHGARMPRAGDLPRDVAPLARRNAHILDDARWKHDTEVLIGAIAPMIAA